jgi:hypothetical protein
MVRQASGFRMRLHDTGLKMHDPGSKTMGHGVGLLPFFGFSRRFFDKSNPHDS